MTETIQSARVPGTETVISVRRQAVGYTAVRVPGDLEPIARTGNYLEMGRDTEAEAREAANFLWSDSVARRTAYDAERAQVGRRALEPKPEITEGVWATPDGTIYKVQTSRGYGGTGGGGNLYGKKLVILPEAERYTKTVRGVEVTVKAELVYQGGVVRLLENARAVKLSDEQAAAVGALSGYCMFCGRDLTDERSTTVGYGPDCAEKRSLPWGEVAPITDIPVT